MCAMLYCLHIRLKAFDVNCLPWSVSTFCGHPCLIKTIWKNFRHISSAVIFLVEKPPPSWCTYPHMWVHMYILRTISWKDPWYPCRPFRKAPKWRWVLITHSFLVELLLFGYMRCMRWPNCLYQHTYHPKNSA